MAINQNSASRDPRLQNPNRNLYTVSPSSPFQPLCSTSGDPSVAEETTDNQLSSRKVKLLCSFGGNILPRPSDGKLRYAGGQTRIISIRRDTIFPELCRKMADAYGGPVAIRYQLPDEGLDALVSVSSSEDLDNMMEEFDKLAEVSGDGAAKLRVFLFPQTEMASILADNFSAGTSLVDPHVSGQKYIEAVNGGSASDVVTYACEIRPKDSTVSASFPLNSDVGFHGCNKEGASPTAETSVSFDPSRMALMVTATSASSTALAQTMMATHPLNQPHHVHCMPPHPRNIATAPQIVNVVSVPQHTFLSTIPTPPGSISVQVGSVKPVLGKVDSFAEEGQLSGRFAQPLSNPNYNIFQPPFSQIPPLQPSHFPPVNLEPYELHVVPPSAQAPGIRFEDCQMCQKALPHVHSERLMNELGNVSGVLRPNDPPIVHSYHSEDIARLQGQHSVAMMEYSTQPHLEGSFQKQILHGDTFHDTKILHPTVTFAVSSSVHESMGACLNPPQTHLDDSLQNVLPVDSADYIQVLRPSGTVGLSSTSQTSYSKNHDEFLQQQQLPVKAAPSLFLAKQEVSKESSSSINNVNYNVLEPLSHYQGYVTQVDGLLEALNVSTFDTSMSSDWMKPIVADNFGDSKNTKPENLSVVEDNHTFGLQNGIYCKPANPVNLNSGISKEIKTDSFSVVGEDNYSVKTTHGGHKLPSSNEFINPVFLPNENSMGTINHPLLSTMMNSQHTDVSQVSTMFGNSVSRILNFERGVYPSTNHQIPRMSPYMIDSAYPNFFAEGTTGAWEEEVSQVQNLLDDMSVSQRGNAPFHSSSSSVIGHKEQLQETFASSSLLDYEEPQEIIGSMNTHRPRPAFAATREPIFSESISDANRLLELQGPDMAVLLEEGVLQPPVDWVRKDSLSDSLISTKENGADYINQDLHDLAEQVVESVLQPSLTPMCEDNFNSQSAAVLGDQRFEDIKGRQSDKLHIGMMIANNIGRLQIIKNSDLEELQELGSGTFGTVYHGKWRGSDVAIKRINDRCFAGKPSEQEKMRADFWNEASKLADLHHPNVVAFYGVVTDCPGGSFATVTEYMVNGSLRSALQKHDKTFDQRKRLLIAMDVAFGMEYLHSKNIVHFDLKSDNLLVNLRDPQRPICKVGDLGLSKVKCQTLISGGVRGTLPWMAPELLNGSSNLVSEKVDVFSFGIVMWELLTGEEPYSDLHYGAIIGGIVSNTLRPVVPDSCNLDWRALMEQCWSAEPSERPSFAEIADRLRSMAASLPQKVQTSK